MIIITVFKVLFIFIRANSRKTGRCNQTGLISMNFKPKTSSKKITKYIDTETQKLKSSLSETTELLSERDKVLKAYAITFS